jgi:hypothetical protein
LQPFHATSRKNNTENNSVGRVILRNVSSFIDLRVPVFLNRGKSRKNRASYCALLDLLVSILELLRESLRLRVTDTKIQKGCL